jgi:hypothetical protein
MRLNAYHIAPWRSGALEWVLERGQERPLYLDNRKSAAVSGTSGSCHNPTLALQQMALLFDHLVGAGEQYRRHVEAKRLGGLEIDDQLKFGRAARLEFRPALPPRRILSTRLPARRYRSPRFGPGNRCCGFVGALVRQLRIHSERCFPPEQRGRFPFNIGRDGPKRPIRTNSGFSHRIVFATPAS